MEPKPKPEPEPEPEPGRGMKRASSSQSPRRHSRHEPRPQKGQNVVGYVPEMDEVKEATPKVGKQGEYRARTGRQHDMIDLRTRRSPVDYVEKLMKLGNFNAAQNVAKSVWRKSSVARLFMDFVFSFGRFAGVKAAEDVFAHVQHASWMKDTRGAPVLQALIRVCAENGEKDKVQKWTQALRKKKVPLTAYTYNSFLRLHAEEGNVQQAHEVMRLLRTKKLGPNAESYNNMLRLHVRRGDQQNVQSVVLEMQKEQVGPTDESWDILMQFFKKVDNIEAAEALYQSIVSSGLPVDVEIILTMMRMHLARANLLGVLGCHEELTRRKLEFGRRTCEILFDAIRKTESKSVGLQLLRTAAERRVRGTCNPQACQQCECANQHILLARHVQKLT